MNKNEIDLRNKSPRELLSEYSKIAQKIQECKQNYDKKNDLDSAIYIYKKVILEKKNNN